MRHRTTSPALAVILAGGLIAAASAQKPTLDKDDRVRIAEGQQMAAELGDRLWPGWSEAPFAVLLVTKTREFLIAHPAPSADFEPLDYDSLLECDVFVRKRTHEPNMLATFPAVGGVATIVIGQPENTQASTSTRWVLTLLHEHFHQWQMSQPDYYSDVAALGLAGDDETGMWMLNYPFPYDDTEVADAFDEMCRRLGQTIDGDDALDKRLNEFLEAKARFRDTLDEDDYAYFSFQVWQEGIARYTELMMASSADLSYQATAAFQGLADYVPFGEDVKTTREMITTELEKMSLKKSRRTAFYYVGAAEGLLLDRVSPGWRDRYFEEPFAVDGYFPAGN